MSRALAAIEACNDTLYNEPMRLMHVSADELQTYRTCLDDRPRSRQHFYLCTPTRRPLERRVPLPGRASARRTALAALR